MLCSEQINPFCHFHVLDFNVQLLDVLYFSYLMSLTSCVSTAFNVTCNRQF